MTHSNFTLPTVTSPVNTTNDRQRAKDRQQAMMTFAAMVEACHANIDNRIICECSHRYNDDAWTSPSGHHYPATRYYFMIDFSDDCGQHPVSELGVIAYVSDSEGNTCVRARSKWNIVAFLLHLYDNGKIHRCYVEGY